EAPGLLADRDDPGSLVTEVAPPELEAWEDRVDGRMRRKMRALRRLFEDCEGPAPRVRLGDGRIPAPVTTALAGGGTLIAHSPPSGQPRSGAGATPREEHLTATGETSQGPGHPRDLDVYGRRGLTLVRGEGAVVWDENGRSYIDCIGGHGALALGHRHPALTAALQAQAERLWYAPGAFQNPARTAFLEALHQRIPPVLARTFLSNSGTEAVEAALKFARLHTGRSGLVAAEGGFHGRTMGSLSVTAERRYRDPFEPLVPGVRRVPFNDAEALAEAVDDSTAGVILEPVQGESGVHPASKAFLQAARGACDESGALLILDEVQTGFGRTGTLFAFQRSGIVPDILCLAKSVAGGLPLGATVLRQGIEVSPGAHGSTFGGNPIACAVGRAVLQVLDEPGFLDSVDEKGTRLADRIRKSGSPQVKEVRQVGLMIGIQVRTRARPFVEALQERGILALTAGTRVIRLLPPLIISDSQLGQVEEALLDVLANGS
ncbi:MAG: acetylornithine/succinylornithine family transaminase, partial [Gemmatimonadota bacterium]|nr:acetylornithine/succinylornithine family transaminase [Gemmatimonadota bacterium]